MYLSSKTGTKSRTASQTLFKTIEGVFERLHAIDLRAVLRLAEEAFSSASLPKGPAIELKAALRHPLIDNIVVDQRALIRRGSNQADHAKCLIKAFAELVKRFRNVAEG